MQIAIKEKLNEDSRGAFVLLAGLQLAGPAAQAQSDPFLGEIRFFAGDFAPRGWALCDGKLLPISQHQALFSILGINYGGDGRTTFALPDMRGRFPIHPGGGPGLTMRRLGEKSGAETNNLTVNQMPAHSHEILEMDFDIVVNVYATEYVESQDSSQLRARSTSGNSSGLVLNPTPATTDNQIMIPPGDTESTGNNQEIGSIPPYIGVNCIIALEGVFPSRN